MSQICLLIAASFLLSCSEAPGQRAAKHEARGDGYVQQEQFREAVIEYKNAARATPDKPALQWKLAKSALQVGDHSTAFTSLSRIVQLDPKHFDAQWALGDLYLAAGKTDEATKIAGDLLTARPHHPAAYLLRAGLALRAGQAREAVGFLKQAVEHDPTMVRPLLALGNIYFARHEPSQAAEWYERAVKAGPDVPEARLAHGQFLFASGSAEAGREEFRKAVELSRDQERIRLVLADRYVALGQRGEAERELVALMAEMNSTRARKALAELKLGAGKIAEAKPLVGTIFDADPRDAVGLYLKGRLAFAESNLLEAASLLEEAMGRDVTLPGPHLYLGLVRLAQGRAEPAQTELREATRLQPDNATAHLALANLYLRQQKAVEAQRAAWQVLQSNAGNLEAAVLYGDALMLGGNFAKAEELYGAIIRQLPAQPIGYVKMAALRKSQGRLDEAAQYCSQALGHAPTDRVILQDYLAALLESKQAQRADAVLKEYLEKFPRDSNLWRVAGGLYAAQSKMDQAEKALRKAVELAPDVALVHYELGQLYVRENKLPAAESAFQTALNKEETSSFVHTAMGMLLARQGKVDAANDHYRRAVQLEPNNAVAANNLAANLTDQQELDDALGLALAALDRAPANPAIKDTLGWIYYKKERFAEAHRLLTEASTALPQHPLVRYHHAVALAKIGKQDEALVELRTALSLPGGFPGAEHAAQMLAANKIDD